jgi:AraC-like DNA-binding protein
MSGHTRLEASDPEEVRQLLVGVYGSISIDTRGGRGGMRMTQHRLGEVRLDRVRFGMGFDASGGPLGALHFGRLLSGRVGYGSDGRWRAHRPGDVYLAARPEHPYTAAARDLACDLAVVPTSLLGQVAGAGRDERPVSFTGCLPVTRAAATRFAHTLDYVRTLADEPPDHPNPLLAGRSARLLLAVALATFPNTAVTEPTATDRHDAGPAPLRRAIAFIDSYAGYDITVADIATVANVTIRAIRLAFRRHLDTTPTAYLRRVRLDRAHRDLLAADPGTGATVAAIAARWGFPDPSRFATAYRQAYGRSPDDTPHGRA